MRDTEYLRGLDVHRIPVAGKRADVFDVCQRGWHDGPVPKALPVIDTTTPICCAPVAAAPMDAGAALEVAVRLKALAAPVRVRLMSLLLRSEAHTSELQPRQYI